MSERIYNKINLPENCTITAISNIGFTPHSLMAPSPPEYTCGKPIKTSKKKTYAISCDSEHGFLYTVDEKNQKMKLLAVYDRIESRHDSLFKEFWIFTERLLGMNLE